VGIAARKGAAMKKPQEKQLKEQSYLLPAPIGSTP
jgi:hypothetical protein